MKLFQRTASIISANVNDFVDRFENPRQMLRQALREIEVLVAATSSALARSIATEKLLAKTAADHSLQADKWRARAAEAVAAGDEALARRAIARQLEHQNSSTTIQNQVADAREATETLRRQLDVVRKKHDSARARLMIITARQAAAEAQGHVMAAGRTPGIRMNALAEFERYYERLEIDQAEAAAIIDIELDTELDLESEFERQATSAAIDLELLRLKNAGT